MPKLTRKPSARSKTNFTDTVIRNLRERVAFMCSNPLCRRLTVKRAASGEGAVRQGKASHILPASPGGPRAEIGQTAENTKSFENGIWLCDICAREVDDNRTDYPAHRLRHWKAEAETYVEGLVTQDTRLRQLRGMMSPLLSTLRILNALPGPGPCFDQTFATAGKIPITRLLIEAEQSLFEHGFQSEADQLLRIKDELERVCVKIYSNAPTSHLDISNWKNQKIRTLMIDIMRFSEVSYQRYFATESAMVQSRHGELRGAGATVIPLSL